MTNGNLEKKAPLKVAAMRRRANTRNHMRSMTSPLKREDAATKQSNMIIEVQVDSSLTEGGRLGNQGRIQVNDPQLIFN